MQPLPELQIQALRNSLANSSPRVAIPSTIGGFTVCQGFWRIFSHANPKEGVAAWNMRWCKAWGVSGDQVFAFGEDVFGNQLVLSRSNKYVHICDHENGQAVDTELGLIDLLESVAGHGVSWLDFYGNGAFDVASRFLQTLDWEDHLHWTKPLILNGAVSRENVSVVNRNAHLSGHEAIWKEISSLPPGTQIRIRPT